MSWLQIQVADLVDENVSHKFCHIHILHIFIIEGTAFVWILLAPSKNQDRQISYVTEHVAKVAYYNVHYSKPRVGQVFCFENFL